MLKVIFFDLFFTLIACSNADLETLLPDLAKCASESYGHLPMARSCDLAVTVRNNLLQPDVPAGATVFLQRVSVGDPVDGVRYVVVHEGRVSLCRACRMTPEGESDPVPVFADCRASGEVALLRPADVKAVYRVIGYYMPTELK